MFVTAHADTWTIAGAVYTSSSLNDVLTNQLFGSTSGWQADNANNDMILYSGTKYYLVKEITLDDTSDATIEFKVCKNHSWDESHPYGNLNGVDNSNGNAWVYLKKPSSGTKNYELLFTFDSSETGSLDAIQLAKIVEDDYSTPTDETSWSTYLGTNVMTLDNQGTYHFTKEYNVSANTNISFKALTVHRSPTYADRDKYHNNVQKSVDNVNGVATTSPNYYVNFPNAGSYELDFEYNILTNELNVTMRRFHDVTISVEGNGLGQTGIGTGYATFSCDFATEVPDDLRAYYITGVNNGKMVSEETDRVPAAIFSGNNYPTTGVVLQGALGTYRFYEYTGGETVELPNNKLCGTGSQSITIPAAVSASSYYVLGKVGDVIAFYNANYENFNTHGYNTYPAYKAFYYTGSMHAREFFTLDFMDESTDIKALLSGASEGENFDKTYYNLQGQPVSHPSRGLYILNGKKVMVK